MQRSRTEAIRTQFQPSTTHIWDTDLTLPVDMRKAHGNFRTEHFPHCLVNRD